MVRPRAVAALLAAALLVAGCGDDDDDRGDLKVEGTDTAGKTGTAPETATTEAAPSGRPVATIRVRETEFKLQPMNPHVDKPGVVEFKVTNAGQVTHALEVEGPNGEQETDSIEPGSSATLKVDLDKKGSYEWYCPIGDHKDRGMEGEIVVGSGSASGSGEHEDHTDTDTGTDDGGGGNSGSGGGY